MIKLYEGEKKMSFSKQNIIEITRQLKKGMLTLDEISDYLPCYLHINSLSNFSLIDIDKKLIKKYDLSKEQINASGIELLEKIIHPIDLENAINVNLHYLNNRDEQSHVAFFQRIQFLNQKKAELYYTRGRVLDQNRILNLTIPIDQLELYNHNVWKLYNNASFIKSNIHKFNRLTDRERQICPYLCQGNSLKDIVQQLNISEHTIKNHKINIYKKLEVNNYFEFYNFAFKFKLIEYDN